MKFRGSVLRWFLTLCFLSAWHVGASAATSTSSDVDLAFPLSEQVDQEEFGTIWTVVEANGIVYAGTSIGLYAFDAATGTELWNYETEREIGKDPAIAEGVVVIASINGIMYALDAKTGAELWQFQTSYDHFKTSPAISHGVTYAGSSDHVLYAVDLLTGTVLDGFLAEDSIVSSPKIANEVIYFGSDDGNVYALNFFRARTVWTYATGGPVQSATALTEESVLALSDDGYLYSLDRESGEEQWRFPAGTGHSDVTDVVASDGLVYVVIDTELIAVDGSEGAETWRANTIVGEDYRFEHASTPTVAGELVVVGTSEGDLLTFGATTGEPGWRFDTDEFVMSQPAYADGVLYAGTHDGNLYAFDARDGTVHWVSQVPNCTTDGYCGGE